MYKLTIQLLTNADVNNTGNFLSLLQKRKKTIKLLQSKLYTHGVNDLSIHLNVADVQYMWNDTQHKDVTSVAFIGRDAIRAHYCDRVADRCRTFPLGALRIFHARGTVAAYVVDNGH